MVLSLLLIFILRNFILILGDNSILFKLSYLMVGRCFVIAGVLNSAQVKRPATALESAAKENVWQTAMQKPKPPATHLMGPGGAGGGGTVIAPDDAFQVNWKEETFAGSLMKMHLC